VVVLGTGWDYLMGGIHPRKDRLMGQVLTSLQARIDEERRCLVVEIPMQIPAPSASGKTLVVASSHGNVATLAQVDGKPVIVGVNAYVRK